MMKIKWFTPDSYDGERTLSQHAFVHKERKTYLGEKYDGNISLCGKKGYTKFPIINLAQQKYKESKL